MSEQKKDWGTWSDPLAKPERPAGQRRLSRVVHDERGNARIEWIEESVGKLLDDRTPLAILEPDLDVRGTAAFQPKKVESGWNPYQTVSERRAESGRGSGTTTRTDLRKLSEWIKLRKQMEERKLRGDDED